MKPAGYALRQQPASTGPSTAPTACTMPSRPIPAALELGDTLRETLGRIEAVLIRRAPTANANWRAGPSSI